MSPEGTLRATRPGDLNHDDPDAYPTWLAQALKACLPDDMDAQKRVANLFKTWRCSYAFSVGKIEREPVPGLP